MNEEKHMLESERLALILKKAYELTFELAITGTPDIQGTQYAQDQAWLEVGRSVHAIIESVKSPDVERRDDWDKWKDNFCKHISDWSYFSADEELETMRRFMFADLQTKLQEAEEANGHVGADLFCWFCARKKITDLEAENQKLKKSSEHRAVTDVLKEFNEKFVEFAPDGSNWGAGLRIKHFGDIRDREVLDGILAILSKLGKGAGA